MTSAPSTPEPIEVFALALRDLRAAFDWEAARPEVKLVVTTDRVQVYDAIEIYIPGSDAPQWCVWRDPSRVFHIDNSHSEASEKSFLTLMDALEFISSEMSQT
jgi:hypothetical protein